MPKFTNEDKTAMALINAVDKISLDLEEVGRTIAYTANNMTLNRLEVILETAQEKKGEMYVRYNQLRK